jgi:hypothetical protein
MAYNSDMESRRRQENTTLQKTNNSTEDFVENEENEYLLE